MARAAGSRRKKKSVPARPAKGEPSGRERILASALALLEGQGYRATSVNAIASRAGVAKGSVYWHFKCKEDLLVAIVDREIERVKRRLGEMFGGGEYDPTDVISLASNFGFWVGEGVERIKMVVLGALLDAGGGPKARRLEEKLVARSRAAYLEAREALSDAFRKVGPPAGIAPETAATCLMACLGGLVHLSRVMDPSGAVPQDIADGVREIFLCRTKRARRSGPSRGADGAARRPRGRMTGGAS